MKCHRLGELVNYRYLFLIVVEAEKSKPRYWQIHFLMKFFLLVYRQPPSYYVPTHALYTQEEKEGGGREGRREGRGREGEREEGRRRGSLVPSLHLIGPVSLVGFCLTISYKPN